MQCPLQTLLSMGQHKQHNTVKENWSNGEPFSLS